jgi:hypothetical protein
MLQGKLPSRLAACIMLCVIGRAQAQVIPPFFSPNGTAFTPEIGVVNTGVLNDVRATVSADEKYVTLTMQPSNSTLLALREFTFQNGNPPVTGAAGGAQQGHAPVEVTFLDRQGITRVN